MSALAVYSDDNFSTELAKSFGKACDSYLPAARLQQQVAQQALSLLAADANGHLVDLGCGPGWLHPQLVAYCQQFSAIDLSAGMLAKAAELALAKQYLQADAQALPLRDHSVDKLFSSLMLQWCSDPELVLNEINRVLKPGGHAVLTTLTDGTLSELKQAFAALDNKPHVNPFLSADALMNAAKNVAGIHWQFALQPVVLYYSDVQALARELKALGASRVAGRTATPFAGKAYWQKLNQAYEPFRHAQGLAATYQVLTITGQKK